MRWSNLAYLLSIFLASANCDCNRGFVERDRPLISVFTKEIVHQDGKIFPFWVTDIVNGGNLVVEKSNPTCIVVPATGIYTIFVTLDGVRGSIVQVVGQTSTIRRHLTQCTLNSLGTTICGSVSYLEANERITFTIENGELTSASSMQLFAYLVSLSA